MEAGAVSVRRVEAEAIAKVPTRAEATTAAATKENRQQFTTWAGF